MLYEILTTCYQEIRILKKKKKPTVEFGKLGYLELYVDAITTSGMRSFPGPGLPDRALSQSLYL